ncbi:MAG: hypothetical protein GY845_25910 [Planctomycetes bacterium]|nr:hypothetical protein [Planctomycetota bacterium]
MAQEILPQNQISANTSGWNTLLNDNTDNQQQYIKTFVISHTTPAANASDATIQLEDAAGNVVNEVAFVRVRIADEGEVTNSSTATISAVGTGTIVQTFTATKDLLIKSDANGTIVVTITDVGATGNIFTVNIGPSEVNPMYANYHNQHNIDFA